MLIPGCKWLHDASMHVDSSESCRCLARPQITGKMNVLLIEAVLKGYRECPLKYGWVNLWFLRKNWEIQRTFGDAKFSVVV